MNREQYQAKRMWLRGTLPDDGNEGMPGSQGVDETSSPPMVSSFSSLADYYLSFHSGRETKEGMPN